MGSQIKKKKVMKSKLSLLMLCFYTFLCRSQSLEDTISFQFEIRLEYIDEIDKLGMTKCNYIPQNKDQLNLYSKKILSDLYNKEFKDVNYDTIKKFYETAFSMELSSVITSFNKHNGNEEVNDEKFEAGVNSVNQIYQELYYRKKSGLFNSRLTSIEVMNKMFNTDSILVGWVPSSKIPIDEKSSPTNLNELADSSIHWGIEFSSKTYQEKGNTHYLEIKSVLGCNPAMDLIEKARNGEVQIVNPNNGIEYSKSELNSILFDEFLTSDKCVAIGENNQMIFKNMINHFSSPSLIIKEKVIINVKNNKMNCIVESVSLPVYFDELNREVLFEVSYKEK